MTGIITSTKMTKAVVVAVYSTKVNNKYKKRYKSRKKYMVACENPRAYKVGDTVNIEPSRPISKNIKWVLTK